MESDLQDLISRRPDEYNELHPDVQRYPKSGFRGFAQNVKTKC
jgi:hypothetical protein